MIQRANQLLLVFNLVLIYLFLFSSYLSLADNCGVRSPIYLTSPALRRIGYSALGGSPFSPSGRRRRRFGRIMGGNPADFGEWPWQVGLYEQVGSGLEHHCGAVLLDHNWVVTAGHCVYSFR